MARFKPNRQGYLEVLNGDEMFRECTLRGDEVAISASRQSGIDYAVDTIRGMYRIHTRVTSPPAFTLDDEGSRHWNSDYFRESNYRALNIAAATRF